MMKRLILAAAMGASLTGAAFAQAAATPDDCLKQAFDLAQEAEKKKLGEGDLDKLEAMLSKMEAHCDAKEFDAAAKQGSEIKTMLGAAK